MIKPVAKTKRKPEPAFVKRARRAMNRAAKKVAAENKRLGLPLLAKISPNTGVPAFARRGERALLRAAKKVSAENKRLGLPLVFETKL